MILCNHLILGDLIGLITICETYRKLQERLDMSDYKSMVKGAILSLCHTKNMIVNEPEFAHVDEVVLLLIPLCESCN